MAVVRKKVELGGRRGGFYLCERSEAKCVLIGTLLTSCREALQFSTKSLTSESIRSAPPTSNSTTESTISLSLRWGEKENC